MTEHHESHAHSKRHRLERAERTADTLTLGFMVVFGLVVLIGLITASGSVTW